MKTVLLLLCFSNLFVTTFALASPYYDYGSHVEDECKDDWIWGDCVPWSFDANGCGIEGRQEARREGLGCHIIAFTVKCIPSCKNKNRAAWGKDLSSERQPQEPETVFTPDGGKDLLVLETDDSLWGVNDPNVAKSGCEYEVTTEWSDCDRNGHKYRSKKLISGPPVCSREVEEVETCQGDLKPLSSVDRGSSPAKFDHKGSEVIGGDDSVFAMARDEAPKPEKCSYTKFTPWSKCNNGQKYRSQNLKSGPNSCASQNTEYKSCTNGRKTGCQYRREDKKCGKCSREKPDVRVCKAPLDVKVSADSCDRFLAIEKPC